MKILYQGHGSLRLITDRNTVVYLDPCAGEGYDVPADVILVTHQHGDHNRIEMPARGRNCVVIQNSDALVDGQYKSFRIEDLVIEAVPAYNRNHDRDECAVIVGARHSTPIHIMPFHGDKGDLFSEEKAARFLPPGKLIMRLGDEIRAD